jgi:hypothetical protein
MERFIEGEYRGQTTLMPECLEDYVADTNPIRVVDVFVDGPDLFKLGFVRVEPSATGRPSYPLSSFKTPHLRLPGPYPNPAVVWKRKRNATWGPCGSPDA